MSKKANKPTRSSSGSGCFVSYFALILVVFGISAFTMKRNLYSYNYYSIRGTGGQVSLREIGENLNSILCTAYDVTPLSPADSFLVHGKARVNRQNRKISRRTTQQIELFTGQTKNSFYLLEYSHISVNACRNLGNFNDGEIVIIKGDKSYEKWKSGSCDHCPIKRMVIDEAICQYGGNIHLRYTVRHIDTYYVVLVSHRRTDYGGFKAELKVSQTTYDTSSVIEECHQSMNCQLKFPYSSNVDVVVKFKDDDDYSSVGAQCVVRTMLWIGLFAMLPACFLILGVCCCCWCGGCSNEKPNMKQKKLSIKDAIVSTSSKANLIDNEDLSDYGSVVGGQTCIQTV